jgi:glutamine synthetase
VSFVERHGLWTAAQTEAAIEVREAVSDVMVAGGAGLSVVRFAFVDAHGVLRGKTLVAEEAASALSRGVTATTTMLLKDLSGRTAFPVFSAGVTDPALRGAGDMVMVPDPTSFRVLPWAPHTGWLLCDLYLPDGTPHPYSTRALMRRQLKRLAKRGFSFVAGLEVEFHLLKLAPNQPAPDELGPPGPPPAVELLNHGYQYLTEQRYDALDPILEILRANLQNLGLPLRSLEIEFGPSQVELTFAPTEGLEPADLMVLFRSAVKQIAARHGYHASFMCRPKLPGVVSSGWHLHQSLRDPSGANAFATPDAPLSQLATNYLAGLLHHASPAAAFSTPTINGYKRYRPHSMAPDRAIWARDNRGVMVRVLGGPGDPATRLENRVGEPAANPYLYMASQIAAGLDGIDRMLDPGPSADAPYETPAPSLPRSLMEALAALRAETCFHTAFGNGFVDYFLQLKEAEISRFLAEVTDWEHREYFELL